MKNFDKVSFHYSIAITLLVCFSDETSYFIREKKSMRSNNRTNGANKKKHNDTKSSLSSFSFLASTFQLHTSTNKKEYLYLVELYKDVRHDIKKKLECEANLRKEDGHNWTCEIKYKQDKTDSNKLVPLLCSCSYEYDCPIKYETFYFSYNYKKQLTHENKHNHINRGPEHQCEKILSKTNTDQWSCEVKKNVNNTIVNEEYFCDCKNKNVKKCVSRERLVDFYS